MGAGAVGHLTGGRHRAVHRRRDLGVVEPEHLAQHEHRALVGAERFEDHHHRHRHRLGQQHIGGRVVVGEQQRLGQPRPHVVLAAAGPGAQCVERLAGDQLRQIGLGVAHRRQVHLGPPQVAVLQHIIGFGCRAEDLVGDGEQQRTQGQKSFGVLGGARCGRHLHQLLLLGRRQPDPAFEPTVRAGAAGLPPNRPHRATADRLLDRRGGPAGHERGERVSSRRASCTVPRRRPRLMHWATIA